MISTNPKFKPIHDIKVEDRVLSHDSNYNQVLRVHKIIVDAKFKMFGCGAAIATSSIVTELVKGKTVDEALKVSNRAVAEALGGYPLSKGTVLY